MQDEIRKGYPYLEKEALKVLTIGMIIRNALAKIKQFYLTNILLQYNQNAKPLIH